MIRFVYLFIFLGLMACAQKSVQKTESYAGLGKDSVSAETLKKFAPPALPEVMLTKIKKSLDVLSPGLGMMHPNHKQLFFTWKVSGQTHVWRLDAPNTFPVQLTGGKDATMLTDITPDGKWLVLSRDEDGQENPGIFLQSPEGGDLIKVFLKAKVRASASFITDDSEWLYFSANDIKPDANAIYRYNLKSQKIEIVFDQPGLWYVVDHRKNGDLLLAKQTGSRSSEYFEFTPASKSLKPIVGQNEKEEYTVAYSKHPGEFIILTPKFEEFSRLYKFKNGKFDPITPTIKHEIESFNMDHDKTKIVYQINDGGYTKIKGLEADRFTDLKFPEFKGAEHIFSGSFSQDGKDLMLGISYAQAPRSNFSYNFTSGKLTSWVKASVPEVDVKKFVRSELEYYSSRDGVQIPMFVRRPAQCVNKSCPVVVHFHGGPEGQSIPGFSPYLQLFVDAGFVFVEPNVRGSAGYGKTWIDSDNKEKRLNVITDIEDAARFIKSKWAYGGVVPKVGVMGGSYGGYSTLMAMTKFAGAYDAGVAIVGMSNLYTFLQNTAPYRRILRTSEYGDPETQKDILLKLSPITYLDQVKSPLMIIQGANDPRVPVGEAIQIQEALQKKNIPSQLIIFPDEGHGSQKKENQALERGHTLQFLINHLMGSL